MVGEELAHAGECLAGESGGGWCAQYPALDTAGLRRHLFTSQAHMLYILHHSTNNMGFGHGLARGARGSARKASP